MTNSKKTVQYLLAVIVVGFAICFPAKWAHDWRRCAVFSRDMDVYEKKMGPKVADLLYYKARHRDFLSQFDAGSLASRLSALEQHNKIPQTPFSFQLSTDFYSSVIRDTRFAVWAAASRKVQEEMGLDGSAAVEYASKDVRETYYRRVKEKLDWFEGYEQLADLYGRLPFYYPDTIADLARYEAELKEVRPKFEELLAKL